MSAHVLPSACRRTGIGNGPPMLLDAKRFPTPFRGILSCARDYQGIYHGDRLFDSTLSLTNEGKLSRSRDRQQYVMEHKQA